MLIKLIYEFNFPVYLTLLIQIINKIGLQFYTRYPIGNLSDLY